ncbi:hypothetical protein [Rhizobium sp. SGZ-381]|uniref:hypothetical protein n=1 Tax=Rhizobium sp. SGZ-381 TaxID=3342800 RepID=UPI00366C4F12
MTITSRKDHSHREQQTPGAIEWLVGLVSALLIVVLIAWMAREAIMQESPPPQLDIEITGIEKAGRYFRVDFELANRSDSTAAAVRVEGVLRREGAEPERSDVTFDYAPAHSSTKGGLLFEGDPAAGTLTVRPTGFAEP